MLWLSCRLAAEAPIQSLAWELLCAAGTALKENQTKHNLKWLGQQIARSARLGGQRPPGSSAVKRGLGFHSGVHGPEQLSPPALRGGGIGLRTVFLGGLHAGCRPCPVLGRVPT